MKIVYNGGIAKLKEARDKANELLNNPAFYDAIAQKPGFDFTTATGPQVAASMKRCKLDLTVKTFKKHFTRTLGYESSNDPTSIYINVTAKKLDRSLGSIVGTFIHEAVHAADADDDNLRFGHNGNKAAGNKNTVPYWVGNLAVQMVNHPAEHVDVEAVPVVLHALQDEMPPEEPEDAPAFLASAPNFSLEVRIFNQEHTPENIEVSIKKRGSSAPEIKGPQQNTGFVWKHSLAPGDYILFLKGANAKDASIIVTLTGTEPPTPDEKISDEFFMVPIHFSIA